MGLITLEERRRIKDAADRMDEASDQWISAIHRPGGDAAAAMKRWAAARHEFVAALDAVTDWSTAPAPVGKDA